MPKNRDDRLGVGWAWPIELDASGVKMCSTSAEDIQNNLTFLRHIQPGTRLMRPDFGCDVQQFYFEIYNENLCADIEKTIRSALTLYEPRIDVVKVETTAERHNPVRLTFTAYYRIRGAAEIWSLSGILGSP